MMVGGALKDNHLAVDYFILVLFFFSSTDFNLPFSLVLRRMEKKVEGLFSKVGVYRTC